MIGGDAPSRGHDLKQIERGFADTNYNDAPSRGHDLKLCIASTKSVFAKMPPHGGMT